MVVFHFSIVQEGLLITRCRWMLASGCSRPSKNAQPVTFDFASGHQPSPPLSFLVLLGGKWYGGMKSGDLVERATGGNAI